MVLILIIPWTLCLDSTVSSTLLKEGGVWYYIVTFVVGRTVHALIFGPRFWNTGGQVDIVRAAAFILRDVTICMGLIFSLGFITAAHRGLASQKVRVAWFGFAAILKSRLSHFLRYRILMFRFMCAPPPNITYVGHSELHSAVSPCTSRAISMLLLCIKEVLFPSSWWMALSVSQAFSYF